LLKNSAICLELVAKIPAIVRQVAARTGILCAICVNSFVIIDPLAPESNKIFFSFAGLSIAPVFISPNSIGIRTSCSLIFSAHILRIRIFISL